MQTAVLGGEADLQMAKTTAVEEDFPLESWIKRPQLILVANSHRETSTLRAYHPHLSTDVTIAAATWADKCLKTLKKTIWVKALASPSLYNIV